MPASPTPHPDRRGPVLGPPRARAALGVPLLLLGVLAGAAGGVAIAAVAGARRTARGLPPVQGGDGGTRRDRLRHPGRLAHGRLRPGPAPPRGGRQRRVRARRAWRSRCTAGRPAASHLPTRSCTAPSPDRSSSPAGCRTPDRLDEVVVNRKAATTLGIAVGDRVTIHSAEQPRRRSTARHRCAGARRSRHGWSASATPRSTSSSCPDEPGFLPSGAAARALRRAPRRRAGRPHRGGDEPGRPAPAGHRPRRGSTPTSPACSTSVPTRSTAHPFPGSQIPIRDLAEDDKRVVHATDLERVGLLLFAAAAALGEPRARRPGHRPLRGRDGRGRPDPALARPGAPRVGPWPGAPAARGRRSWAAAVAVAVAVALSPLFPVGLAGRLDPDRGVHLDSVVVLPGAVIVLLAVIAAALVAAGRATGVSATSAERADLGPRPLGPGRPPAPGRSGRRSRGRPGPREPVAADPARDRRRRRRGHRRGRLLRPDPRHRRRASATPTRSGQIWQATAYPDLGTGLHRDHRGPRPRPERRRLRRRWSGCAGTVHGDRAADLCRHAAPRTQPLRRRLRPAPAPCRRDRARTGLGRGPAPRRRRPPAAPDRPAPGRAPSPSPGSRLLPQTPHSSFDQGAAITPGGHDPRDRAPRPGPGTTPRAA